jgi:hypothetical protein
MVSDKKDKHDPSFYPIVKPSDALGVFTDTLDARFDNMEDSYRARMREAMRAEDKVLRAYVDKAQLESWYAATLEAAEMTVARELDEVTAQGAGDGGEEKEGGVEGGDGDEVYDGGRKGKERARGSNGFGNGENGHWLVGGQRRVLRSVEGADQG